MKTVAVMLLVASLTASAAYAHTDLTPAEVKAMIDSGGPLTILDVREESEFCDSTYSPPGHIPRAVNMPWNSGYLHEHYGELPTDEDIVVVCRSGSRSNSAANYLDGLGFTRIFDMLGGMNAWEYETTLCGTSSVSGPGAFDFVLQPASPNPFNIETEIVYMIPAGHGPVNLTIYDARGRLVTKVVETVQAAGMHRAVWNGTDVFGRPVSSGLYFCRLKWNGKAGTVRMVLAR